VVGAAASAEDAQTGDEGAQLAVLRGQLVGVAAIERLGLVQFGVLRAEAWTRTPPRRDAYLGRCSSSRLKWVGWAQLTMY